MGLRLVRRILVVISIVALTVGAAPVAGQEEAPDIDLQTWSDYQRLSWSPSGSYLPSIAVSGADVHLAWSELSFAEWIPEIVYKHSTDGGVTWSDHQRLSFSPGGSHDPSLAVSGTDVHVAWYDWFPSFGRSEIVYKHSTDGGVTWSDYQRLSFSPDNSKWPSIAASGADIHIAWQDLSFGNFEIVYKHSTGG